MAGNRVCRRRVTPLRAALAPLHFISDFPVAKLPTASSRTLPRAFDARASLRPVESSRVESSRVESGPAWAAAAGARARAYPPMRRAPTGRRRRCGCANAAQRIAEPPARSGIAWTGPTLHVRVGLAHAPASSDRQVQLALIICSVALRRPRNALGHPARPLAWPLRCACQQRVRSERRGGFASTAMLRAEPRS
jgi:hypothetical protein